MKVYLVTDAGRDTLAPPAHGSPDIGAPPCACGADRVRGQGRHASSDDRAWEATAVCVGCGVARGTLRVETETLFGVTEDEAVLKHGRARVYG